MIKYWDYIAEYERDREKILGLVHRVFSSGRLILGPSVSDFEARFAAFCGSSFGIGVASGTDALFLALKSLGIGPGHEVITVSNTAVPTIAAIREAGAAPVFVDVEEDTFLMDHRLLASAVTERTRCILPVHLFGQCADMDAILREARIRSLFVVEDCAQATGALYNDRKAGSMGDIGAFSFYPTKLLGAYGDGGIAITNDEGLAARLKRLRFYGMDRAYYAEEEGFNSRLDEVQAALLAFKLQAIHDNLQARARIALHYNEGLAGVGDLRLPAAKPGRTHGFYAYTLRTKHRNQLMRFLAEQGIETKINYPAPIHLMRGYAFLGYGPGDLPVTEKLAGEILSLPIYPCLAEGDAAAVIAAVRKFFEARGRKGP